MSVNSHGMKPDHRTYMIMGSISAAGADVDRSLTKLLCTLTNPGDPDRVLPLVRGRNVSEKINALDAMLPPTILDASTLIKHLRASNEFRNSVAHSSLDYHFEDIPEGGTAMARAFNRERRTGTTLVPIDLDELERNDAKQKIVVLAASAVLLHLVTYPHEPTGVRSLFSRSSHDTETHVVIKNKAAFDLAMEMFPPPLTPAR